MSKGLDALERIKSHNYNKHNKKECLSIIEKELKRLEELEEEKQSFDKQLEKKLKALEIIRNKQVVISRLLYWRSLSDYNFPLLSKYWLEQEEYDLLKEVLL